MCSSDLGDREEKERKAGRLGIQFILKRGNHWESRKREPEGKNVGGRELGEAA